jgi:hypothetical protein
MEYIHRCIEDRDYVLFFSVAPQPSMCVDTPKILRMRLGILFVF